MLHYGYKFDFIIIYLSISNIYELTGQSPTLRSLLEEHIEYYSEKVHGVGWILLKKDIARHCINQVLLIIEYVELYSKYISMYGLI